MNTPIGWPEAQRICDIPQVREALDKFAADAHEENMLAMVSAIMGHAVTQGRAAGLEEERAIPEEVKKALDRMCKPLHDSVLSGATAAADAYCMEVIRNYVMSTASPTSSDAGKDDARNAALEEVIAVLTKRIQWSYQSHQRTDGETGERYFDNDYAEQMEAAYHAELGALAEVMKLKRAAPATLDTQLADEPVAVVGDVFSLYWIGRGPIAPIIRKHGIKVGSLLYTRPQKQETDKLRGLLEECSATLKMWADVAPAVSLIKDIDAALSSLEVIGKGEKG